MFRHRTLTLGGTFWPLHRGHKALLEEAFNDGLEVFIGLTSDRMLKGKSSPEEIPGYGERKRKLIAYLQSRKFAERAHVLRIEDEFGFAADFPNLQAIAVTKETLENAKRINQRRIDRGMKALDIVMVGMVAAENGEPISSARIRVGEIDSEGRLTKTA